MSVLLYVGIINILCMYHIKYYVMFSYMHCVCDMLFHICGVMLCCIYNVTSWKHLRMKATPDLHLTYSKNRGNQG